MPTREQESSPGGVTTTLGALNSSENYFSKISPKWLKLFERMASENELAYFPAFVKTVLSPSERKETDDKEVMDAFCEEMKRVRKELKRLVGNFMPTDWQKELCPLKIEVPNDPLKFAERLKGIRDENSIISRVEFEMLRAVELAGNFFVITNKYYNGDDNDTAEERRIKSFLKYLGVEIATKAEGVLDFWLDPADEWRCKWAEVTGKATTGEGGDRRKLKHLQKNVLLVELAPLIQEVGLVPPPQKNEFVESPKETTMAIVVARRKRYLEAFTRRFRDPQRDLFQYVPDLFGERFCYFKKGDMGTGADLLSKYASMHSSTSLRNITQKNKYSCKNLHLIGQQIFLDGRCSEIQHMPIIEWLNIEHSTAEEGHSLYQMRWYTEPGGLFDQLFPFQIYGKNWNKDKKVREIIEAHIKEEIEKRNRVLVLESVKADEPKG